MSLMRPASHFEFETPVLVHFNFSKKKCEKYLIQGLVIGFERVLAALDLLDEGFVESETVRLIPDHKRFEDKPECGLHPL